MILGELGLDDLFSILWVANFRTCKFTGKSAWPDIWSFGFPISNQKILEFTKWKFWKGIIFPFSFFFLIFYLLFVSALLKMLYDWISKLWLSSDFELIKAFAYKLFEWKSYPSMYLRLKNNQRWDLMNLKLRSSIEG